MVTQAGLQRYLKSDVLPVSLGGAQPSYHDEWLQSCIRHYDAPPPTLPRGGDTVPVAGQPVNSPPDTQGDTEQAPPPPERHGSLARGPTRQAPVPSMANVSISLVCVYYIEFGVSHLAAVP